ncbi:hypothetical protein QJ854_gp429 [Moumouvirus goulette]|uniref:Uncharacterized protein n=1 Tax=Moumouvirus goulette TaxID=1247379 RepID=M1PH36_9VIRU|nr:hypothetical protein QJ854_gp429 [Moumouvirus goulette]AGF85353.1 hypothetical protein glt_00544 [Moumouvirus goulette]
MFLKFQLFIIDMSKLSEKEYVEFLINLYKQQDIFKCTNDYLQIINDAKKLEESFLKDVLSENMPVKIDDVIQYQNNLVNNIMNGSK